MAEDIVLNTESGDIHGTLLSIQTDQKTPVVLMIAGSGPTDRDGNNPMMKNNVFKMLAEGLYAEGIASVRYDKRGIGESQSAGLSEVDLCFENYVRDAVQWVGLLRGDARFKEVIVLGHSEGSLIGMLAAKNADADRFISVAGPGKPAADIIRAQLESQPDFVKDQSFPILEALEKGDTVGQVPILLNTLFRPSVQPYLISWFKYDPGVEIASLAMPVLILQGTTDIQVSVDDAKLLQQGLPSARLAVIDGMNHVLKVSSIDRAENIRTYSDPELALHEDLMENVVGFIRS